MKNKLDRPISLLLVNEIRLMGNVIVAALEDETDIDVVACVTTYDEALEVVQERDVDGACQYAAAGEWRAAAHERYHRNCSVRQGACLGTDRGKKTGFALCRGRRVRLYPQG